MPPDTTPQPNDLLDRCEERLRYTFKHRELLQAALTHTSGANTRSGSYERLEFLGDSVLGLVTCELLFRRFPQYQEGDLTKLKSAIVSRTACARFIEELKLDEFLVVGKGIASKRELPTNLRADLFEALIGAIYLDGGLEPAKEFILDFLEPELDLLEGQEIVNNAKSQLQQIAQRELSGTPRYIVLDEQGPDHNKAFKIAAEVNKTRFPPAWGKNKKEAESRAAMNALAEIRKDKIPFPSPV